MKVNISMNELISQYIRSKGHDDPHVELLEGWLEGHQKGVETTGTRFNINIPRTFLSTSEVASLVGISTRTVTELIKRGKIPARKWGRAWKINVEDMKQFHETENPK